RPCIHSRLLRPHSLPTPFPYTTLFRSTASGPRMPESRCGCFGNVVRFWRPGASSKNGSASSGTFRPTYQSPQVGAGQVCGGLLEIGRAHVELQSPDHLVCRLLLEKKKS